MTSMLILSAGSRMSIFWIRSLAAALTEGQGSAEKGMAPAKILVKMSFSVFP